METIEVINHPTSQQHKIYKVCSKGRVYAVTFAQPFPIKEDILKYFKNDRRNFHPFDESTNTYL